jgi:hypothetical protein
MESHARRIFAAAAPQNKVTLRYVTGSYLGIMNENTHCPNGPNFTRALVRQLKQADR